MAAVRDNIKFGRPELGDVLQHTKRHLATQSRAQCWPDSPPQPTPRTIFAMVSYRTAGGFPSVA
jgi:hypothetical protein